MSIPSHLTTSNNNCDMHNSYQLSQFFISPTVFHGNATHPSMNLLFQTLTQYQLARVSLPYSILLRTQLAYTRLFIYSVGILDFKIAKYFIQPVLILTVAAILAPPYPSRVSARKLTIFIFLHPPVGLQLDYLLGLYHHIAYI